uniref:Uncharacterized protein n=1 Tax=Ixodes scapularis TaxID=6945 RepID=A0A4D5S4Z4_IXOSC
MYKKTSHLLFFTTICAVPAELQTIMFAFRASLLVAVASYAFAGYASPLYGYRSYVAAHHAAPVYTRVVAPAVTAVHHGAAVSHVSSVSSYRSQHPVATPVARYLVRLQVLCGSPPRRPSVHQGRRPSRHRRPPRSSRVPRVERQQLPEPAPCGHPGRPLRLRPHGPGCGHCPHRPGGRQGRRLRCPGVLSCPCGPNSRLRPRIRLRSGHLRTSLRSRPEHLWLRTRPSSVNTIFYL